VVVKANAAWTALGEGGAKAMVLLEVLLLASDVRGARLELQAGSGMCMPKKDGAKPPSRVALIIEGKFIESVKGETGEGDMGEGE
jgi:hypothetical protein